ncbi:O-antigen ligase family protein [Tautonia sociabilis]|uniref:O-antigen ligase-related domain-containing protein n=1 Tax=Tautonia sociabilis TaxID=2080755 RepID=A0A432MI98_9BACT|nr:O-antigen ligase family protein [Tautonia sociabilis]RUL87081.1 hypothetical protein TsocGM_14170 [Tautonia sociabilis]
MSDPLDRRPMADRAAEGVVLASVALAPWAFGSVEAWAEWLLYAAAATAAVLSAIGARREGWRRRLCCAPSLALLGLAALAAAQAAPMPEDVLRRVSPPAAEDRAELLPDGPVRVLGDDSPAVSPAPATISRNPEATRDVACRLLAAWLLLQAVLGLGGGSATYRRFGAVVAVNAAALAGFALVQALTWNGKIFWVRPSPMPESHGWYTGGPFVSHGPLAAWLNLGLGLAIGLMLTGSASTIGRSRGIRPGWAYAAGLIAFGVVASQSRGAFVGMIAATALLLARSRGLGRRAWFSLVGLAGLVVVMLAALGSSSPLVRLASILDAGASGYSVRLDLWRAAADSWRSAPVLGHGFGAFELAVAPRLDRDLGLVFRRAENEYLDVLVEGGLVGLGLAMLLVGSVVRLGLRAWRSERSSPEGASAMVLGGLFGLVALLVHCLGDFSPHIPGLSIAALALCGHLARLGLASRPAPAPAPAGRRCSLPFAIPGPVARLAAAGAAGAIGLALLGHGWERVRAESAMARSGLPLVEHVTRLDGVIPPELPADDLSRARDALRRALARRPDWAAGHLLLARVELGLYRCQAIDWIQAVAGGKLEGVEILADPLWVHAMAHADPEDGAGGFGDPIEHEPVRNHLVPAARSFLEALRCAPRLAEAHGGLAGLDYLLVGGDGGRTLASRAERLAGADTDLLGRLARLAAHQGDARVASRRWRRLLSIDPEAWEPVALAAAALLSPDEILDEVVPPGDGRTALRFAGLLFAEGGDPASRDRFLRAAAQWLPKDDRIAPADRLALEAEAWAGLGRTEEASRSLARSLVLEPGRLDRRRTLVDVLITRGELDEARRQAQVGLSYHPGDPVLRRAIEQVADRIARGDFTRADTPAAAAGDRVAPAGDVL